MKWSVSDIGGLDYLVRVTALLQSVRLGYPTSGLWEAADLQWSWRKDQHDDPLWARFWSGEDGGDLAAVVFTDWGKSIGFDVLASPGGDRELEDSMWAHAVETMDRVGAERSLETSVDASDAMTKRRLEAVGFLAGDDTATTCWMPAGAAPPVSALAQGYRLRSRAEPGFGDHHMIARNGPQVERFLQQCSLYRPDHDLFVESSDGSVAAYGLFWADPVTGVGLVEPMRTEDAHQGRGLARHVLTAGLRRLADSGCSRLKITYMDDNETSGHLYRSAGFVPTTSSVGYGRPSGERGT